MPIPPGNAIVISAMDLISSALRLIGVLAAGEQPSLDEANDALSTLIQMIDAWNADGAAIFTTSSADFPFVSGKQTYTLGPGGDFDAFRPAEIDSMSAILLSNPANPIEVPIVMYTVDQWQNQVPVKQVSGTFPQICYDDGGFPLRALSFWPIPLSGNSVRIYSWQALTAPSALQTSVTFPPGYAEASRHNLALRLGPEYSRPVPASVAAIAVESLARVKTMNAPLLELRSDLVANDGGYNYRADLFGIA